MNLATIQNAALLEGINNLLGSERELTAKLLAYLAEIEERRLHLELGHSSMFDYCVSRCKMSEGQAYRRILAARLAQRFPAIYSLVASGALHLSALQLLDERLTEENHGELLAAASGKTKRELELWLAARFPRPDVPDSIRKLPERKHASSSPQVELSSSPTRTSQSRAEPLSESRFKIEFTASAALREKLQRAQDLLSHTPAGRDLALLVENALDLLIPKLESRRLGKLKRSAPKPRAATARSRRVSRAVRRQVFERDGEQCTYVAEDGHRCPARALLELDHVHPRAMGGADDAGNLRVRCRPHNQRWAEQVYGREHIARQRNLRQRKRTTGPAGEPGEDSGSPIVQPDTGDEPVTLTRHEKTHTAPVADEVQRALEQLGFRPAEAREAIAAVQGMADDQSGASTFEGLLRAALRRVRLAPSRRPRRSGAELG